MKRPSIYIYAAILASLTGTAHLMKQAYCSDAIQVADAPLEVEEAERIVLEKTDAEYKTVLREFDAVLKRVTVPEIGTRIAADRNIFADSHRPIHFFEGIYSGLEPDPLYAAAELYRADAYAIRKGLGKRIEKNITLLTQNQKFQEAIKEKADFEELKKEFMPSLYSLFQKNHVFKGPADISAWVVATGRTFVTKPKELKPGEKPEPPRQSDLFDNTPKAAGGVVTLTVKRLGANDVDVEIVLDVFGKEVVGKEVYRKLVTYAFGAAKSEVELGSEAIKQQTKVNGFAEWYSFPIVGDGVLYLQNTLKCGDAILGTNDYCDMYVLQIPE